MYKKTILAVAAAAVLLIGATEADASCGSCGDHSGGVDVDNYSSNNNYNNNSSYNKNTNTNTNTNNNNNTNNNANNSNANANASANSSSSGGDGSSNVSVGGDEAAASGAAPVYLTTSNDTCMGSSGIGGQGMSFGFSLGTTWTDSNCIMLKNARELKVQGHDKAAKARLCMDGDNALAFELAGEPCPRALGSTQAAIAKMREFDANYVAAAASEGPRSVQTAQRSEHRLRKAQE